MVTLEYLRGTTVWEVRKSVDSPQIAILRQAEIQLSAELRSEFGLSMQHHNRSSSSRVRPGPSRKIKIAALIPTEPLTPEEVVLYKQLPILTLEQIGRILQKRTVRQVYEMTRSRAARPLPVFRSGKELCSTWDKIQRWIEEGFEERAA